MRKSLFFRIVIFIENLNLSCSLYEGVAFGVMSQFVTLGANGKTLKFWFFVIRVPYEKLGHLLKLVLKFRSDLSVHLKDIAKKQVPAKLKPIVGDLDGKK